MRDASGIFVGLMSGTSLDGISAAVVRFNDTGSGVGHELLGFTSTSYTDSQRARLASAMVRGTAAEYCTLNFELGEWLADAATGAMQQAGVEREEVRAIASHGQTIWHSPRQATWQMGEAAVIAERTGVDVISDFRVRDVAAGGEGAPLVPMADALLYNGGDEWRILQNIGGIGNVTVVPPYGDVSGVRAFDTGPGVVLIDHLVRLLYPHLRYDDRGTIAMSGRARSDVVSALLQDAYFMQQPPKSTGREHFGPMFAERLREMVGLGAPSADVIATAVALTAQSVGDAVRRFVPEPANTMVISGGGARNDALVQAMREAIAPRRLEIFDELYYDGEAKEAVAFALLGMLHIARRPGNVIGATAARGPRVLGKLTPAL
ncbi:MAG TPA: anhydro-N-acetylmuramic acid kinase [Gemmatimonadaceae bacterium]|jgi:anhydro-N-acetylmuramic acid kinase